MRIRFIVNIDWFFLSHRLDLYNSLSKKFSTTVLAGYSGFSNKFKFDYFDTKGRIPTIRGLRTIRNVIKNDEVNTLYIVVSPVMIFLFHVFFQRVPYAIYNFSGLGELRSYPRLIRLVILKLFQIIPTRGSRVVIVQNSDDELLFQNLFLKNNKIEVKKIPGSGYISKNDFDYTGNHTFRVGYVGRIRKDKGILSLLRAFQELEKIYSDVDLVIWGNLDDPKRHGFSESELMELELNKKYFNGHSDDKKLIYNSFDWFCLPSNGEGLSKSAIEASAHSKILLLSDVPGNRDMINDNGLLFEYNSVSGILSTLIQAYKINEITKKKMAMNSFAMFKNKWQFSVIAKQWYDILLKIDNSNQ